MVKIATWNVNSLRVRLPHVLDWLQTQQPDILAVQETKLVDEDFPSQALQDLGYEVLYAGQKTYNGVALFSRLPAVDPVTDLPDLQDPQRRLLAASIGDIRVLNVYVPNGQAVGTEKYAYKLDWLAKLAAYVRTQLEVYPKLLILGDFNIAPEDRDVHDPAAWSGKILCSEPERDALQRLLGLGLNDAFRLFEQAEASFSWWDYRAAGFRRNLGLRIDLLLISNALAQVCTACWVDKIPRSWERPSDHAPVIAKFAL